MQSNNMPPFNRSQEVRYTISKLYIFTNVQKEQLDLDSKAFAKPFGFV